MVCNEKPSALKIGVILSYLQMALGIIVQLLYTPFIIRTLGQSEYGLYNTGVSTISMLSILSLGFNSSYIRYFAKYKQKEDKKQIYKLNGLFLLIFLIIGFIACVCGLIISNNLKWIFAGGLTEEEYILAKKLMLLLTFNLAISFPMSVFANIISANERFVYLKVLGLLKTILGPFFSIPLLCNGFGAVALVSVTLIINILIDILYCYYVFFCLKDKFYFKNFEKGIIKDLFIFTGFIAINMVIDQVNWNVDKVLLGRFQSTGSVAVYSVGYTLYQCYSMFSTSISNIFTPRIHLIVNKYSEDFEHVRNKELTELFVRVGRIQYFVLALLVTGFCFFGKQFVNIWVGGGYEDAYWISLMMMFSASIALTQNIGIEIQRALNKHRFRSIVYLFMAFVNLGSSIMLCKRYGAVGTTIGTAFSLILANGIIMNIYYQKKCGIEVSVYWKNIIEISKGFIPALCAGILITNLGEIKDTMKFLYYIVLYTMIYCGGIWVISMNQYERNIIKKIFLRIKRGKNDSVNEK